MTKKTVDKLIELQKIKKEELELQLKEVQDLLDREMEYLRKLEYLYKENRIKYEEGMSSQTLYISEIDAYTRYFSHIFASIENQKKIISFRIKELEKIKEHLIEAHKDEKVLEKLLDRIIEEKRKIETYKEQKEMDYLFLSHFGER